MTVGSPYGQSVVKRLYQLSDSQAAARILLIMGGKWPVDDKDNLGCPLCKKPIKSGGSIIWPSTWHVLTECQSVKAQAVTAKPEYATIVEEPWGVNLHNILSMVRDLGGFNYRGEIKDLMARVPPLEEAEDEKYIEGGKKYERLIYEGLRFAHNEEIGSEGEET